jgi:translocation and assembly module TamB
LTRLLTLCLIWALIWPLSLAAQGEDEDRGFLTGLLESSLGGEGRTVRIDGFAGAFSSTATIDQITIADSDGIWLTLDQVAIGWNRAALLRGAIEITDLTAERIDIPRPPLPAPNAAPAPEAAPFALPDLPASLTVETMEIGRVSLGAPVLGEAIAVALSGSAQLAGGAGNATFMAARIDGQTGQFNVAASYDNDTRALMVDLDLVEAAGGLISGLLNVPDRPSLDLKLAGDGNLSDFEAVLSLRTDEAPRLNGTLNIGSEEGEPMDFNVDLQGDVTALFLPEYADFFGPDVQLVARGARDTEGAMQLDDLALTTRALRLRGQAALNADAWPTLLDLEGDIGSPSGEPVLLPGTGAPVRINRADLRVRFDAADGDALNANLRVAGLETADATVENLSLLVAGTLTGDVNAIGALRSRITLDSAGVGFADAGIARAVGTVVRGQLDVDYVEGQPLALNDMALSGADWALAGSVGIDGLSEALQTTFDTTVTARDLSAFAELAGLALDGSGTLDLSGTAALGGFFDIEIVGETQDLAIGVAQADAVLRGRTGLDLAARRDETGTVLDRLVLQNDALRATASATLKTDASQAVFNVALRDVGLVTDAISGPFEIDGTADQTGAQWAIKADLSGPLDATAALTALIDPDSTALNLAANVPDLSPVVPQLKGAAQITATATQTDGAWQFGASVDGPLDGSARIDGRFAAEALTATYSARVPDVSPLVPQVSGPLGVEGTLAQQPQGWQVDANLTGPYGSSGEIGLALTDGLAAATYSLAVPNVASLVPGIGGAAAISGTAQQSADGFDIAANIDGPSGTRARVSGRVGTDGLLDLATAGEVQLGLANPFLQPRNIVGVATFDLSVNGPPALSSVRGQITTQGTRLAAPNLPLSFNDISGTVTLNGTQAALGLRAGVTNGGAVLIDGPIGLSGGYPADISIALNAVQVSDPALYASTVNGALRINGNLRGGARISGTINVGDTTVQVPSSGISSFGAIPEITHIGATRPVMRTQDRAGLSQTDAESGSTGPAFPLDITVNAPARIFVRGRGIDAELGGTLRLTGTSADTISTGQFNLIRGRMDILTKRFQLDEGLVRLQGRFEPFLRFVAATTTGTGSARIIIEGPADDPVVTFESTPEAPQDEVLAQIFFGRDITQLSAFQALQLANAVATLAGRGGEGIISRLRGSFALDDLDVTTDDAGNTAVRAGKYISDNIYTDVTVGGADGPEVSLNIDLTPNITVRGSLGADSNTGVGIFIEKDY